MLRVANSTYVDEEDLNGDNVDVNNHDVSAADENEHVCNVMYPK